MVVAATSSFVEFSLGMSLLGLGGKRAVAGKNHAVLLRVLIPQRSQGLDLAGILFGQIARLAGVVAEIEKLPLACAARAFDGVEDFPIALPNGAVAEKFPTDPVASAAQ